MSIAITELTGGSTTADASTIVSASFNVTINVPVILGIGNTKATSVDSPTPTDNAGGGSNVYTLIRGKGWANTSASTRRSTSYIIIPKATESLVITITFAGATQTGLWHSVLNCAGADPSGTIVQSPQISNANADALTTNAAGDITMAAFADATNNALLYFAGAAAQDVMTNGGAGYSTLRASNFGTPGTCWLAQWRTGEDLAPSCSWTSSVTHHAVGIEIKALAGVTGHPAFRRNKASGLWVPKGVKGVRTY